MDSAAWPRRRQVVAFPATRARRRRSAARYRGAGRAPPARRGDAAFSARCRRASSGRASGSPTLAVMVNSVTSAWPASTNADRRCPLRLISSSPSPPWTTQARVCPGGRAPRDRSPFLLEHAEQLVLAPAGLVSGPSRLNTVRTPSSFRTGAGMAHRGVMRGREHEAHPGFGDAARHFLRPQVDVHAKRLQHVGAAAARRDRPVAVLRHRHAGAGHHEGGAGRDVEGAAAVAAGAAGVDGAFRRAHCQHLGPHSAGGPGDLLHGLAAGPKPHEQRADLDRRRRARHHEIEGFGCFLLAEALAGSDLGDRSPQIGEDRCPRQHGIRGHRPLLLGSTLLRAALPGQDRGSWQEADVRALRRCSRGETVRHARGSACAASP